MSLTNQNRINYNQVPILSNLRAFAALSVCLYHFVYTTNGFFTNYTLKSIMYQGQYGVQTFFVISGFIIPWSMYNANYSIQNFFRFLIKRLVRLEPPYLVSILITLFIFFLRKKVGIADNSSLQISAKQVLLHLGYLIPFFKDLNWLNQVYWTLAIEFQYYISIALLFPLFLHSNKLWRYFLYLIFIGSSYTNNVHFLPYWLPFFLLGILFFLYKKNKIEKLELLIVCASTLLFCLYRTDFWCTLYAIIPLIAIYWFQDLNSKLGNFLGEISYSIYLLHTLIGGAVVNQLSHYAHTPWQKILVVMMGVAVSVFSAWMLFLLVEKPSKKLSSKLKY